MFEVDKKGDDDAEVGGVSGTFFKSTLDRKEIVSSQLKLR